MLNFTDNSQTILIAPSDRFSYLIKRLQRNNLTQIKVMTIDTFQKKFYFSYDAEALYYLMTTYNFQYDVAKMYLDNIFKLKNQSLDNPKVEKLESLRKDLDNKHLLYYSKEFKEYLKGKLVIFYKETSLSKEDIVLINEVKKYSQVTIYHPFSNNYLPPAIYQYDTVDDEVAGVASQICELVQKNIPLNKIKLLLPDDNYKGLVKRIFRWFNIPLNLNDTMLLATKIGQSFLGNLRDSKEETLNFIENNYNLNNPQINSIYTTFINILNKYPWIDSPLKIKDFLKEDLKKISLLSVVEEQAIAVITSLNQAEPDDYVFLLGFIQGSIPKVKRDEEYLNDTILKELDFDTTSDQNKIISATWIRQIRNTKNLVITMPLSNSLGVCYLSSLNDELNIPLQKKEITYNYSHLFNKIELTKEIDTLVKYGEKGDNLELLYTNYPTLSYNTYNATYQPIPKNLLFTYLNHNLTLSYSAINSYYQCRFRYYIANILKLNIYEETFYTFLGSLFHYILSLALTKEIDIEKEYFNYIAKATYSFNAREKFFLENLLPELKFIIMTIKEAEQHSSLKKLYLEERIEIPYENKDLNINFKGFIDKIYTNQDNSIIAIIDYKTGSPNLNLNNAIYGLDLQLPVYIYLAREKFETASIAGFYLQKILNNKPNRDNKHTLLELKKENLKLQGYSNEDLDILSSFDNTYQESKVIKGMRTNSKGIASKKVLSDEQIAKLIFITKEKIDEAITNITNANFTINPKRIGLENVGCQYCPFSDICFHTESDIETLKEYKNMEFLDNFKDTN